MKKWEEWRQDEEEAWGSYNCLPKWPPTPKSLTKCWGMERNQMTRRVLDMLMTRKPYLRTKRCLSREKGIKEAWPLQHPRRTIELRKSSKSGQVKMPTKSEAQPQQPSFPQLRFNQPRRQAMQTQPNKHSNPIQQQRMTSQWYGMTHHFIPTCHFCGVYGNIRSNCFKHIKKCRVKSTMEKK